MGRFSLENTATILGSVRHIQRYSIRELAKTQLEINFKSFGVFLAPSPQKISTLIFRQTEGVEIT